MWSPARAISAARPRVLRVTVLPPALGPEMTRPPPAARATSLATHGRPPPALSTRGDDRPIDAGPPALSTRGDDRPIDAGPPALSSRGDDRPIDAGPNSISGWRARRISKPAPRAS